MTSDMAAPCSTWGPSRAIVTVHGRLIRAGTDVDCGGVTSEMHYTETGVVSATWGIFCWTGLEKTERLTVLDTARMLELEQAGFEAGVGQ